MPFLRLLFVILAVKMPFLKCVFTGGFERQRYSKDVAFSHTFLFAAFVCVFTSLFMTMIRCVCFHCVSNKFMFRTCHSVLGRFGRATKTRLAASLGRFRRTVSLLSKLAPLRVAFRLVSRGVFCKVLVTVPATLVIVHGGGGRWGVSVSMIVPLCGRRRSLPRLFT